MKKFLNRLRKNILFSVLENPLVVAILPALAIILFLPHFDKYILELNDTYSFEKQNGISFYDDLDGDGFSEYIMSYVNINDQHAVKVSSHEGKIIEQFNFFKSRPKTLGNEFPVFTGDYNSDGLKEIFAISFKHDSIFLDIISPMAKPLFQRSGIFIDTIASFNQTYDFTCGFEQLFDMNRDGFKDIIFFIRAGFSLQPRALYIYDIHNDRIMRTPQSGAFPNQICIADINNDSSLEITSFTCGFGNMHPDNPIPYCDSSSYLMVFDDQLNFLFEPLELKAYKSYWECLPVKFDKNIYLFSHVKNTGTDSSIKSGFVLTNTKGKLIRKVINNRSLKMIPYKKTGIYHDVFFLNLKDHSIYKISDTLLNPVIHFVSDEIGNYICSMDIDNDTLAEHLFVNTSGQIIVMRNDFSDLAISSGVKEKGFHFQLSIIENGSQKNKLFLQNNHQCYVYDYRINKWHYLIWPIRVGIYAVVWVFIFFLRRLYRNQVIKQQIIANQISELQIKSLNNQVSPHFILNALNAISASIYRERNDEAYNFSARFSMLIHESLSSSDKISRTLEKEIDFVINYLELEKYRFQSVFTYEIIINEDVNIQTIIPKMIIQTFAENAVKHGLRHLTGDGKLKITISNDDNQLQIIIDDNGIGRQKAKELNTAGTGKGLQIIDQMTVLYKKLAHKEIHYEIFDIEPQGTRVVVEMISKLPG